MKVIFRTNAGKEGLGHLNRAYSLYVALKQYDNFRGLFVVNQLAKTLLLNWNIPADTIIISEDYDKNDIEVFKNFTPDVIVIDTYKASKNYFLLIRKEFSSLLILIDDNLFYKDIDIDIIINGNIFAEHLQYRKSITFKKALLGPKYLIMNPDYWNLDIEISSRNSNILITCGGADPKNITYKIIDWLKLENFKKNVVIGPYFEEEQIRNIKKMIDKNFNITYKPMSLKTHILNSDIVLTASGSTVYEVISLKRLPIIYCLSEDQLQVAKELEKRGILFLGWYHEINHDNLEIVINKAKDEKYRLIMKNLFSIFDGNGTMRVVKEILSFYD